MKRDNEKDSEYSAGAKVSSQTFAARAAESEDLETSERTLWELDRLEQGALQQLGDELLSTVSWAFFGLRPKGMNPEGKTHRGTPDSYVGPSAKLCRTAVEYTTQRTDRTGKCEGDYASVRKKCPDANVIGLCTSRSLDGEDLEPLMTKAKADGVTLHVIDAGELSRLLCNERQDLRRRYLGIPTSSHTPSSLIQHLARQLPTLAAGRIDGQALERPFLRATADTQMLKRLSLRPQLTLVTASAGVGKSTWSYDIVRRHAGNLPVLWTAAQTLASAEEDPISLRVAHTAFGSASAERAIELAELLSRCRLTPFICIDGLDEAHDYAHLIEKLRIFHRSSIGRLSHILLTCRAEAAPQFKASLQDMISERECFVLRHLRDDEARLFLEQEGATPEHVRQVERFLTKEQLGNPFYLGGALSAIQNAGTKVHHGDVLLAIADRHIHDIAKRLRRDGKTLASPKIKKALGDLAYASMLSMTGEIDSEQILRLGDPLLVEEGENTLMGRAVQAGLLVSADGKVRFRHALFAEHFTAYAIAQKPNPISAFNAMPASVASTISARVLDYSSNREGALQELLRTDIKAACKAACQTSDSLSTDMQDELRAAAELLLDGSWGSDIELGLDTLARLANPRAAKSAATWFNGLDQQSKAKWVVRVADLFLELEEIGAFQLFRYHSQVLRPADCSWYEPDFVRRLDAMSDSFRADLKDKCWAALQAAASQRHKSGWVHLLGQLRDDRLVGYLSEKIEDGTLLDETAHRALIFLNTPESIETYAGSVDALLSHLGQLSHLSKEEQERTRSSVWYRIVLKQSDIPMFPHDELSALVHEALNCQQWRFVSIGMSWAETLADPTFARSLAIAKARHPQSMSSITCRGVEAIARRLDCDAIEEMYKEGPTALREELVRAFASIPGQRIEDLLLHAVDDTDLCFYAVQSLSQLRAVRAAPRILELLRTADGFIVQVIVTALGRLGFGPAVPELTSLLNKLRGQASSDSQSKNLEYVTLEALGRIGGREAYSALAAAFAASTRKSMIVSMLLRNRAPAGLAALRCLAGDDGFGDLLLGALSRPDGDGAFQRYPTADIEDEALCETALAAARAQLAGGSLDYEEVRALACFCSPGATEFLEDVAELPPEPPKPMTLPPRSYAQGVLAHRGVPRYVRLAIDACLDEIAAKDRVWFDQFSLQEWPDDLVREAVLSRLESGENLHVWLYLLRRCATPADHRLFESYRDGLDPHLADIAQRYLSSPEGFRQ